MANNELDAIVERLLEVEDDIIVRGVTAPERLAVAASRIIGKKAAGNLSALTAAEVKTILAEVVAIEFNIDGGGSVITTGLKGVGFEVPFACTITQATLFSILPASTNGSIVVDVWKNTYAGHPPTVANTITAAAKPTITAAQKSQDSTLTGWTTAIAAGDILFVNVDSCATFTAVTLSLKVTKT